jgi:5-oxoprolinase (ATP-hydrolysing)
MKRTNLEAAQLKHTLRYIVLNVVVCAVLLQVVEVYFETGYQQASVYILCDLHAGHEIPGPAIIMDNLSTVLVEPDCTASITSRGDIRIIIGAGEVKKIGTEMDPIQLSIFSHRFMSIAEQMGR